MLTFDSVYQTELLWRASDPDFREDVAGLLTADLFDPPLDDCFATVAKRKQVMSIGQARQLLSAAGVKQIPLSTMTRCPTFDKEQVVLFVKTQRLRNALLKAQVAREKGLPDEAIRIVRECERSFKKLDLNSYTPVTLLSTPPKPTYRTGFMSTGLKWLDRVFGGGVGSGELAIVMAPTNGGKTTWLLWLAGLGVLAGKHVVFITLETPAREIVGRVHRMLTESDPVNKVKWKKIAGKIKKQRCDLTVLEFPPHTITTEDLSAKLPERIDLLLVDPPDSMLTRDRALAVDYFGIGSVYLGLKGIGMERKIPVWTSSQVNRTGYEESSIQTHHVEGSLRKMTDSDQVISLQQSDKSADPETGLCYARLNVAKNRYGVRLVEHDLTIHFATSRFREGNWT